MAKCVNTDTYPYVNMGSALGLGIAASVKIHGCDLLLKNAESKNLCKDAMDQLLGIASNALGGNLV